MCPRAGSDAAWSLSSSPSTGDRIYSVISCPACSRLRIIDDGTLASDCPYCGKGCEHRRCRRLFSDKSQAVCRDAIGHLYGFEPEADEKNERIGNADPVSTLTYRYEHCGSVEDRLEMLAEGLTAIHGTFTIEEVSEIDPVNAEKLLEGMHERCLIAEVGFGRYKG